MVKWGIRFESTNIFNYLVRRTFIRQKINKLFKVVSMEKERLLSLDAFRGFTIMAMILVNFPGSWSHIYPPLLHATWNGLTPTDLIFPFFLFMVGISIAIAYSRRLAQGASKRELYGKILSRTVKIFIIGVILNFIQHFQLSEIRYAGVLQRIAIVFLLCSVIFLEVNQNWHLRIGIAILVFYWLAMVLIPTPGYSISMLEPGTNLAAWVDNKFLPGKLWQETWDPEGILSTLPALVTCIIGMITGTLITGPLSQERKVIWMFTLGIALTLAGYVWSWVFPLNKNLWTSSFVLLTGGFAMMILATSIFRIDMLGNKRIARIGLIFGANAISVYILADLLSIIFYRLHIGNASLNVQFMKLADAGIFSHKFLSLSYAFLFAALIFIPAWWMYKRRIFIKL